MQQYNSNNNNRGIQNPGNFGLWNPESLALESIIQLKESRIPLTIGIWLLRNHPIASRFQSFSGGSFPQTPFRCALLTAGLALACKQALHLGARSEPHEGALSCHSRVYFSPYPPNRELAGRLVLPRPYSILAMALSLNFLKHKMFQPLIKHKISSYPEVFFSSVAQFLLKQES